MLVGVFPLVVLILGMLMYVLASNPKVQEMGRILFFVGAFWLVQTVSSKTVHLGQIECVDVLRSAFA